jgi:hypothetical protein
VRPSDPGPEEPWEREIHELLSSLPPVDPPDGFLARAIDHRPKYAGRLSVSALASVAMVTLVIVGLGLVGDPTSVAPAVPNLTDRHLGVVAGLSGAAREEGPTFELIPDPPEVVDPPAEFRPMGLRRDGDLVQLVYERGGEPVSIFVQPGSVDWGQLPPDGMSRIGDRPVWTDVERRLVIVEAGGHVVCVLGVEVDEALEMMRSTDRDEVTVGDRLRALARDVARQAGFP